MELSFSRKGDYKWKIPAENGPILRKHLTYRRARPVMKPDKPRRGLVYKANSEEGSFTKREATVTMRPHLRSAMPSITLVISSIGASIIKSIVRSQSSLLHLRNSRLVRGHPPLWIKILDHCNYSGFRYVFHVAPNPLGLKSAGM
ncbi:hypothetical protein ACI0FR_02571 [Paenochrobactrum sp. BZR 201-1]